MAIRDTFTRLIPKEVNFVRGEQPAPSKLNGAFKQIESALTVLESFLGNGTDYRVTDDKKRRMIFNISAILGRADKLYKPVNKLQSLKNIYNFFIKPFDLGTYDEVNDIIILTSPLELYGVFREGYKFGLFYTYVLNTNKATVGGLKTTPDALDNKAGTTEGYYTWYEYELEEAKGSFVINTNGNTVYIKSMYMVKPDEDGNVFNEGYSIPVTKIIDGEEIQGNASYWSVKIPCRWAAGGLSQSQTCAKKTCNYCIGNVYNYSGATNLMSPACLGAIAQDGTSLSYTSSIGTRAGYYTLQSPALSVSMPYAVRYKPFKMHNTIEAQQIPENSCIIYDTKNTVNPLMYTVPLYSASSTRGDIFFIRNTSNIIPNDTKRYIVLGGSYGVLDLILELLEMHISSEATNAGDPSVVYQ